MEPNIKQKAIQQLPEDLQKGRLPGPEGSEPEGEAKLVNILIGLYQGGDQTDRVGPEQAQFFILDIFFLFFLTQCESINMKLGW